MKYYFRWVHPGGVRDWTFLADGPKPSCQSKRYVAKACPTMFATSRVGSVQFGPCPPHSRRCWWTRTTETHCVAQSGNRPRGIALGSEMRTTNSDWTAHNTPRRSRKAVGCETTSCHMGCATRPYDHRAPRSTRCHRLSRRNGRWAFPLMNLSSSYSRTQHHQGFEPDRLNSPNVHCRCNVCPAKAIRCLQEDLARPPNHRHTRRRRDASEETLARDSPKMSETSVWHGNEHERRPRKTRVEQETLAEPSASEAARGWDCTKRSLGAQGRGLRTSTDSSNPPATVVCRSSFGADVRHDRRFHARGGCCRNCWERPSSRSCCSLSLLPRADGTDFLENGLPRSRFEESTAPRVHVRPRRGSSASRAHRDKDAAHANNSHPHHQILRRKNGPRSAPCCRAPFLETATWMNSARPN